MPDLNVVGKRLIRHCCVAKGPPSFLSSLPPVYWGGFSLKTQISICVF